jgi:hypothetical protein
MSEAGITLFYLSFASPDKWLGCCFIEGAADIVTAAKLAHLYGCNPGGQVMGAPLSPEAPELLERARAVKHRLLGKVELEEVTGEPSRTMGELEEAERAGKIS